MGQARQRGSLEQRIAEVLGRHGVKPLTPERYNAFVAWTRSPIASYVGEELEFFSSHDERLIGVLIKDRTDRDFGYVTLGRDEKRRFRCIDVQTSLTKADARNKLFVSVKKHADTGEEIFPQGIEADDKAGVDFFAPIAPADKLSTNFKRLRDGDHWIPARSILSEMMRHFMDVDGNFVEQFQTSGFDSRIWELYLYAALLDVGLFVTKPKGAPDFQVARGGKPVFIEAVTVGPSAGDPPQVPTPEPKVRSAEEIRELLKTKMPIKFGSALYSKLNRKTPYWELEHVKGHPLVFAIADFHEAQSMTWTSPALIEYLYGVTHDFVRDKNGQLIIRPSKLETHEYAGKKIPSGFFLQPNAEHISGVLFTSSGTISKFNRMGRLAGFGLSNQKMLRMGVRHDHDPNAVLPVSFVHEVKQGTVQEAWAEGLSLFHNPKALNPVDPAMFPGIAHHFFKDGQIESYLPEFHVYNSFTWNMILTEDGKEVERPG